MNEQSKPKPMFEDVMNPTEAEIIASSEASMRDIAAGRVYDLDEAFFERLRLRVEDYITEREQQKASRLEL